MRTLRTKGCLWKRRGGPLCLTVLMCVVLCQGSFAAQNPQAAVESESAADGLTRGILEAAGYGFDETSIVSALLDSNPEVQTMAAHALVRRLIRQPSPRAVDALKLALRSADLLVAAIAADGLRAAGAKDWENDAAIRMDAAGGPGGGLMQLRLAGVLAKAGRSDGWRHVRQALETRDAEVAASQIRFFHGLRADDGQTIDAAQELQQLRSRRNATTPEDVALRARVSLELEALERQVSKAPPR